MIFIKRVKAIVTTSNDELFGFELSFQKGLNIITGSNSSGKSSVLSSIYYCLGMEQVIGGYNNDIFKDSLKTRFEFNNRELIVTQSSVELDIMNKKGEIATLKRWVKSHHNTRFDEIEIHENGRKKNKFLHKQGDTDTEEGFYKWLLNFLGVKLPIYRDKSGNEKKVLYLQYIFAVSCVEQTRGWSDFFAVLPSWDTIKKPKQRIIEYTLGLSNLLSEFEIEDLKDQEKELKEKWKNRVREFGFLTYSQNISHAISETFTKVSTYDISEVELKRRKNTGKLVSISNIIDELQITLKEIKAKNAITPPSQDKKNEELLKKQEELQQHIQSLNKELEMLQYAKINEHKKRNDYEKRLQEIDKQIKTLEAAKKINVLFSTINVKRVSNCPVCNTPLTSKENLKLDNKEKISDIESISFYKSERSLYFFYLKNSEGLMDRFERTVAYYENRVKEKKFLLQKINQDLVGDSRLPSREEIAKEIQLENEISNLKYLSKEFEELKEHLRKIAQDVSKNYIRIKNLESSLTEDISKINAFKKEFIGLLERFNYPDTVYPIIDIKKDKLLPFVKEGGIVTPSIRSKASASDFIRALWAYYLALLINGEKHLGLLIFDEPGQHAMDLNDLKTLIRTASTQKDKQVIFAISNSRKKENSDEEEKNYVFEILLKDFKENEDYHINIIKDNDRGDKAVQPLL